MKFFSRIKKDIRVVFERDPAAKSVLEVVLCYSGLHAIWLHRISHALFKRGWIVSARLVSNFCRFLTGIEIHPGATIGDGLFIDHGTGIVIGETAELGKNVTLYQGVTLGGTGKEKGKRHPTIGNNVMISVGAKVLGSFTIGNNVKVGAGSVVLESIPDNCTVVGVPGRVVRRHNAEIPSENIDHTDLPDPVREDIDSLKEANANLTNHILKLEEELRFMKNEITGKSESNRMEMDRAVTEGMNGEGI